MFIIIISPCRILSLLSVTDSIAHRQHQRLLNCRMQLAFNVSRQCLAGTLQEDIFHLPRDIFLRLPTPVRLLWVYREQIVVYHELSHLPRYILRWFLVPETVGQIENFSEICRPLRRFTSIYQSVCKVPRRDDHCISRHRAFPAWWWFSNPGILPPHTEVCLRSMRITRMSSFVRYDNVHLFGAARQLSRFCRIVLVVQRQRQCWCHLEQVKKICIAGQKFEIKYKI